MKIMLPRPPAAKPWPETVTVSPMAPAPGSTLIDGPLCAAAPLPEPVAPLPPLVKVTWPLLGQLLFGSAQGPLACTAPAVLMSAAPASSAAPRARVVGKRRMRMMMLLFDWWCGAAGRRAARSAGRFILLVVPVG